ncbi:restriction endonuclease [Phytohabitans suffuscus]|uniref:Restriction endonuclease type IV Mrr domain-containing protein n=1 Tax=Phytohabitans suffuscus TaxID=624315 RepID=A0A6F8YE79_9ACTN|nr:restriction endonuclease [Phytohabitans suffuscus]BCB84444.1 hypothetical protein Psuf_017570 [Phytohabitans suffuscus]
MNPPRTIKRIDPNAYNALADALAVIFWNKRPQERYLRGLLRDYPELLARLDFNGDTKRETAGRLVELLMANEAKYQAVAIALMLSVAKMDSFPNLERHEDGEQLLAVARAAVAELRKWTGRHQAVIEEHEKYAAELAAAAAKADRNRALSASLADLKSLFFAMHTRTDAQARGKEFEGFINRLFGLYDLDPRAAYSLEREQIDGAFSFETDDYILEARWWKVPVGREHLDVFKTKIARKGKNALGLFISVNGFTKDALDEYSAATPFITMDGMDFTAVLEERVRLDDLLRRKKRHANETGNCFFPAFNMF